MTTRRRPKDHSSDLSDQTQRFNQQTKRRVPAAGSDPRLIQLEAALEQERETSRQASIRMKKLRDREGEFLRAAEHGAIMPSFSSSWTVDTIKEHFHALRETDFRFYEERDRRYAEVNIEREKALKIKETADLAALSLAREIQDYKDEKANNLRDQIGAERGTYATKDDLASAIREVLATMKPLTDYVTSAQGRGVGAAEAQSQQQYNQTSGRAASNYMAYLVFGGVGLLISIGLFAVAIIEAARAVPHP